MRKEQQWRRWIGQWQRSGLTIRAFCQRHNLSQPSFYAWRREIQHRDATAGTLVPVQLVGDDEPDSASTFEVVLPSGPTLRVPPRFEVATLRQLLAVLQEVRSC
jgi:transposase-like protein